MEQIIGKSILDQYFDDQTMSAHFKEKCPLLQKKGRPWHWESVISDTVYSKTDLEHIIQNIFREIDERDDGFLEIDKSLSKVVQLGPYRIVIVYAPLSDGLEITIVKPVKKLNLSDYNLPEHVINLLTDKAQWILISWAPWSWKTTFWQALIDVLASKHKVIKTVESPRDLLVPEEVVQYSFSYASHSEIRDILLLSRPDYTIYDEVRNTEDFQLYKDLRLTGIWLIGAIHATKAIDWIQRFIWVIEIWIIPQIVDTVIFIDSGAVAEILQLKLVVKIPQWMNSEDLARPVILVTSFLTNKPVYEIYSFGEQIVVMPLDELSHVAKPEKSGVTKFAQQYLQEYFESTLDNDFILKVESENRIKLFVPEDAKGKIIWKWWDNIRKLEQKLGIEISLKSLEDLPHKMIWLNDIEETWRNSIVVHLWSSYALQMVVFSVRNEVLSFKADQKGDVFIQDKGIARLFAKHTVHLLDLA